MDVFLRVIAVAIEVIILTAMAGCLLYGVWLILFDLGLGEKYKKGNDSLRGSGLSYCPSDGILPNDMNWIKRRGIKKINRACLFTHFDGAI